MFVMLSQPMLRSKGVWAIRANDRGLADAIPRV
jgi:hypothetical protein